MYFFTSCFCSPWFYLIEMGRRERRKNCRPEISYYCYLVGVEIVTNMKLQWLLYIYWCNFLKNEGGRIFLMIFYETSVMVGNGPVLLRVIPWSLPYFP